MKVSLASEEEIAEESFRITDIFDNSSRIVLIEADPDNPMCLFVLDEDMQLLKIIDNGEGKAVVVGSVDMAHH